MEMRPENQLAKAHNVLRVIYLLFNEGYYSRTQKIKILQKDFCLKAMWLALLLQNMRKRIFRKQMHCLP